MLKTLTGFALALSLPAFAAAATYEFDPAHTSADFTVRHLMVTDVHGSIPKVSGAVVLDDKDAKKSSVEATLDASTINTNMDKRDAHLKSPDFLDVAKYPSITFKSTKVTRTGGDKAGNGRFTVDGDLTLHGVTRPVTLKATLTKPVTDPFVKAQHRGLSATTKINREDFGLTWNKAIEGGGVLVGKEVAIDINADLVAKPEAAAAEAKTETQSKGESSNTKAPAKATGSATK